MNSESTFPKNRPSSEERFAAIFDAMAEGVVFRDAEGRIQECNPAAERILGLTADQIAGRTSYDPLWRTVHEDGSPFPGDQHPAMIALRTGEAQSNVVMGVHKEDGSLVWLSVNARLMPSQGGSGHAVVTTFVDITELKRLEHAALLNSEEKYRTLLDYAPDSVFLHDLDGMILDLNDKACQSLGYSRNELLGRTITDFSPLAKLVGKAGLWDTVASGEEMRFESRHSHKDQSIFPVEVKLGRVQLPAGTAILAIARDITERKRSEFALQNQVDFAQRIFDSTDSHLAVVDKSGTILAVNEAWRRFGNSNAAGSESDWGAGANYFEVCAPGTTETTRGVFGGICQVQQGLLWEFEAEYPCHLPGEDRWYNLKVLPLRGSPGTVLVSHTNVTARRRAEDALRYSEERHRTILETALDGFCLTDVNGRLLEVNESYCTMSGYTATELLAMDVAGLEEKHPVGDLVTRLRAAIQSGESRFETSNRRKDGSLIELEVSAQYQPAEGGRIFAFLRDITERKRAEAERAKLEIRFRQAQKMESVGRVAGGVAHDFNNLLTVINGYSALGMATLSPTDPLSGNLAEIQKAGDLAARLTKQLLAFSRKQVIQPVAMNLNALIRNTVPMLQRMVGEDLIIQVDLDASLGQITVDPDQIRQVLMNLVINARDAMPNGGELKVATVNGNLDEAGAGSLDPAASPGPCVILSVTDTGSGMDDATKQQIFEPFFTTKEQGKGTGLGLATVYGIVRQSNGWIEVSSAPGAGTSFQIYLPVTLGERTREDNIAFPEDRRGKETILVVEDQDAVRAYTCAVLKDCGYRILEATSGEAALQVASGFPGEIQLLVADVVLPGMNGKVLAEHLKRARPQLRVIFVSGYTGDVISERGVLEDGASFVQKPFSPAALATKVRHVLDLALNAEP